MWTIIRHDLQKTRSLIILGVAILLLLFISSNNNNNTSNAQDLLSIKTLMIMLIYAGTMYLSLYFSDHKQGTLFFLLSSPHSRTRIYWAKVLAVLIPVAALLLLHMVITGYKEFGWAALWSQILLQDLPGAFYLSLANTLFFGSVCALLSQFLRGTRWVNVLIAAYAIGATIYLAFYGTEVSSMLVENSMFLKVLNVLFYQHWIFLSENNYLYGSLFLVAGIALFFAGSQIFVRRNFYSI